MKEKHFIITFANNITVFVTAFNETEAVILAQATMIKNGLVYEVNTVHETSRISDMTITNYYCESEDCKMKEELSVFIAELFKQIDWSKCR